uniref:Uncharacterized protein n=1 Tax=Arundo donax TaxID=35708 RepID=A0A0A9HBN7_ARUDO
MELGALNISSPAVLSSSAEYFTLNCMCTAPDSHWEASEL